MTTYNQIAGRRVNFLSSDPTYVDTNTDGQVWYNSTSATLKAWLPTGTWSAGGSLNTARAYSSGAGTQSAGLAAGGDTTPGANSNAAELYNGIAWTSTGNLNTARETIAGTGTQTAAVFFGGYTGPPSPAGDSNATEKFNGTTWTSSGNMNTARRGLELIPLKFFRIFRVSLEIVVVALVII